MAPPHKLHDGSHSSPASLSLSSRFLSAFHRSVSCVFSFGFCCSKVAVKAIGPVLVTVAISLILFVVVVYFTHIYPTLTSPSHYHLSPVAANLVTAVGLYLLLLALYHYLSTMLINPGSPPSSSYWTFDRRALLAFDPELHSKSSDHRYCRHCQAIKPMRAHHCSLCNRCVLKMDHHCVSEGSLITLADGSSLPIEEVQAGARVLSYHSAEGLGEEGLVVRQVDAVLDQGHRECVELLFSDGRTLTCTPDHRIRTADGRWVQAGDLEVGTAEVAVGKAEDELKDPDVHQSVDDVTHGVHRDARVLPLFRERLVGRRDVGRKHVWDLSVPSPEGEGSRSFVANGVVVHNCPWVNNCVGWRNYRHFTLFCFYLHLLALFFLATGWEAVTGVLVGRVGDEEVALVVASICSVSAGIAAFIFLVWNAYLTLTNQSTIEFYTNVFEGTTGDNNPYTMGWRQNVQQVYGPDVMRTLLLPVHADPPGDGCLFPMNKGRGYPLPQLLNVGAV